MSAKKGLIVGVSVAVIIPLIITFFAGLITWNYQREPSRFKKQLDSYVEKLLQFDNNEPNCNILTDGEECVQEHIDAAKERTTAKKLDKALKVGIAPQYILFNPLPFYDEDIIYTLKDEELTVFHLRIFQTIMYKAESYPDDGGLEYRYCYIGALYDVNYDNIRKIIFEENHLSTSGEGDNIYTSKVPAFSFKLYNIGDINIINEGDKSKYIERAVPEFTIIGDTTNSKTEIVDYNSIPFRNISETSGSLNKVWFFQVNMTMADWHYYSNVDKLSTFEISTTYSAYSTKLKQLVVKDFTIDEVQKSEVSDFETSLRQVYVKVVDPQTGDFIRWDVNEEVYKDFYRNGFKSNVWWISLVSGVVSGLFSFLFFIVAREEKKIKSTALKKRKK
jgi:hypothetical protein